MSLPLAKLQAQAIRLHHKVVRQTRLLHDDRVKLGKLLLAIRDEVGIQSKNGGFRGSRNGVFCAWLTAAGFSVANAYNWMRLAKTGEDPNRNYPSHKRALYWRQFNMKMQRLEDRGDRIALFTKACNYLKRTYRIPISIQIKTK